MEAGLNRYHIEWYFNLSDRFQEYQDGAYLGKSKCIIDNYSRGFLDAGEKAFAYFNSDERLNRFSERSMSTGDVLHIHNLDNDRDAWMCVDRIGLREIEAPHYREIFG